MRAWVIGGSSGIGRACADLLAKDMVVSATGVEEFNVATAEPWEWRGQIREFGFPTHIVYSAGVNHLRWIGSDERSQTETDGYLFDVNFFGFTMLLDALVHAGAFKGPTGDFEGDRGDYPFGMKPSIVAISSDAAERPMRTSLAYCASKAALNMAVRCAARELGQHGWRINAVAPGMTAGTGMQEYIDQAVPEVRGWTYEETFKYEAQQEVTPGRITTKEVAQVVRDTLLGPAHLNGSIVTINGGR